MDNIRLSSINRLRDNATIDTDIRTFVLRYFVLPFGGSSSLYGVFCILHRNLIAKVCLPHENGVAL